MIRLNKNYTLIDWFSELQYYRGKAWIGDAEGHLLQGDSKKIIAGRKIAIKKRLVEKKDGVTLTKYGQAMMNLTR